MATEVMIDVPKKSTEWILEPWAIENGVQSTTRYRKANPTRRGGRASSSSRSHRRSSHGGSGLSSSAARASSGRKGGIIASKTRAAAREAALAAIVQRQHSQRRQNQMATAAAATSQPLAAPAATQRQPPLLFLPASATTSSSYVYGADNNRHQNYHPHHHHQHDASTGLGFLLDGSSSANHSFEYGGFAAPPLAQCEPPTPPPAMTKCESAAGYSDMVKLEPGLDEPLTPEASSGGPLLLSHDYFRYDAIGGGGGGTLEYPYNMDYDTAAAGSLFVADGAGGVDSGSVGPAMGCSYRRWDDADERRLHF